MAKRDKRFSLSLIRYADDFVVLHEDIKVVLQAKNRNTGMVKPLRIRTKTRKD